MEQTTIIRQDKFGNILVSTIQLEDGWYETGVFQGRKFKRLFMTCKEALADAMAVHEEQCRIYA